MQNHLEKNLNVLSKKQPQLAETIRSLENNKSVSLGQNDSGSTDLKLNLADGKHHWYYGGDCVEISRELLSRLEFKNPRIVIFLGFGLGLHVRAYLKNPHPLNREVLIIEEFLPVLRAAFEVTDFSEMLSNPCVQIITGSDREILKRMLGDYFSKAGRVRFANAIEYVPLKPALAISQKYFQDIQAILPQAIGHQYNLFFGDPYDGYVGTASLLKNRDRLIHMPALDQAKGLFAGRPGIVIAAGPSLKDSLPFLKEIQDKAVLAVCLTALPLVLEHGITPHIWLDNERSPDDSARFEKYAQISKKHIFVATPHVYEDSLKANGVCKAYALSNVQSRWLPLPGEVLSFGHSSAHFSFAILERLGCDPIFLVGQDLTYGESGSHASGIADESQRFMMNLKENNAKVIQVDGNSGNKVATNIFWHSYLKSLSEELVPRHKGKVYHVINATQGVKIAGTERINPADLPQFIQTQCEDIVIKLTEKLTSPSQEEISRRLKLGAERVKIAKQALQEMAKISEEFALLCKSMRYATEFVLRDWAKAEPLYQVFLHKTEIYFDRLKHAEGNLEEKLAYEELFFGIVQGFTIRYFIEYFSSADDIRGNFDEIHRKSEILHHMAKDQAYWAREVVKLLESDLH